MTQAHCARCQRVSELHRLFRDKRRNSTLELSDVGPIEKIVRTFCRKCGGPMNIDLGTLPYDAVKHRLGGIHYAAFEHEGYFHTEMACWGWMARFDEVLEVAFPDEYFKDAAAPFWPMPPGYRYHKSAEQRKVMVITDATSIDEQAEGYRQELARQLNEDPRERAELTLEYGPQVFDHEEVGDHFEIVAFRMPFAVAKRREDGVMGTLLYQCDPRYYFHFQPDG